jgi:hypothetical protein
MGCERGGAGECGWVELAGIVPVEWAGFVM